MIEESLNTISLKDSQIDTLKQQIRFVYVSLVCSDYLGVKM